MGNRELASLGVDREAASSTYKKKHTVVIKEKEMVTKQLDRFIAEDWKAVRK